MKKNEKKKNMGFFNVFFFFKPIGSNQIEPNEAHPVMGRVRPLQL